MIFEVKNWNEQNVKNTIEEIKKSQIDDGAKFALINNLNGWLIANKDNEYKDLCENIKKNFGRIRYIRFTGDIITYFKKFVENDDKNKYRFEMFCKKHKGEFTSNEHVEEYLKNNRITIRKKIILHLPN